MLVLYYYILSYTILFPLLIFFSSFPSLPLLFYSSSSSSHLLKNPIFSILYTLLFFFCSIFPFPPIFLSFLLLLPLSFPSLLSSSQSLLPSSLLHLSHPNPSFFPYSFLPSNTLIQSIRVGTYITLLIFYQSSNYLTPHVLSEWMVEVCRFYKCGVLVYVSC